MADYAGAVAAIKQKMADNWTTTPVVYPNDNASYDPSTATQTPWVYFEVIGNGSELRGVGTPGNHVWRYTGIVAAHVFVPINSGDGIAQQYAVTIGEIFRAQGFYNDNAGAIVRTWAPRTDGGDTRSDDGNWFGVTCRIPFEYLHHG